MEIFRFLKETVKILILGVNPEFRPKTNGKGQIRIIHKMPETNVKITYIRRKIHFFFQKHNNYTW